jgi:hypothetical protein
MVLLGHTTHLYLIIYIIHIDTCIFLYLLSHYLYYSGETLALAYFYPLIQTIKENHPMKQQLNKVLKSHSQ